MAIIAPPELVRSLYNVYHYTDRVYKIVKFKSSIIPLGPGPAEKRQSYDHKLDASLSRSRRVVLELALCNPWDYFCTFTLDEGKQDRFDLEAWYKKFTQWIRDQRKKGLEIVYLLVPERHANGAWHCHGLIRLPASELVSFRSLKKKGCKVPWKLVKNNYFNWPAYQRKFGFCSFSPVRSHEGVAFYITKYITKDTAQTIVAKGGHIHRASTGLNHAMLQGEVYSHSAYLDKFLQYDYEFVQTGFTGVKDNLDWTFALDQMEVVCEAFDPYNTETLTEEQLEVDAYMEFVQTSFALE